MSGVLFDVDGTLVDTTYLHAVCWGEALRQRGHHVPMATIRRAIGMSGDLLLDHLLGSDRDHSGDEEISAAHLTLYRQHWGRLDALPGAAALLRRCAASGLKIVLVSSASTEELAALRSALDADDVISLATTSEDAETGKPAPDIVHVALARAGLDAREAVFVGDSVWDGAAAHRAGMRFVGLTCGGTGEGELRDAHAVEVWRDPEALLAGLAASVIAA